MSVADKLISLLAPHSCLVCDLEGKIICDGCAPEILMPVPSRCYSCRAQTKDFAVCNKCRRKSPLKHVWVCSDYEDIAKKLVQKYKFEHARAASSILAGFMAETLPYLTDTLLVPIPTVTASIRQRGFDHAKLLGKDLARELNLSYLPGLSRLGQAKQVGTGGAKRRSQLKEAFRASDVVKGENVLLIDDVLTTGATLEECARTVKRAGAKSINAIVFAQKL